MRKSPLKRRQPLKSRGGASSLKSKIQINPVSLKKVEQMNLEVPARINLCKRAGGTPILGKQTYYIKGKVYPVATVQCWGGTCEKCHNHVDALEPHERKHRSLGGQLSMQNSLMLCRKCHEKEHHPIKSLIPKEQIALGGF